MPAYADDLEWHALLMSGRIREEFSRLRRQVQLLTEERDELRQEVTQLRSQARFGRTPQVNATPAPAPQPRPAPAPAVVATPVVEESKEPVKDLDDSAARFSLLELD